MPGSDGKDSNNSDDADNTTTDALDGVTVADLDAQTRQELKVPDSVKGAVVSDVDSDSNSADAGLQRGDVIVEIDRQPVTNADEAVKICKQVKGDQILVKIWRRTGNFAGTRYISVDNTKKEPKK
ncbi:MAG: PDZ domain-containing protein [Limisphaerales bacterium]